MTDANETLPALFAARVAESGDRIALREWIPSSARAVDWGTWSDWNEASLDVAAALVRAGAERGEAVAVLAGNNIVWPIADVGIIFAGLVSVGIYPTASMAQVRELLVDCGACVIIVDSGEQLAKVRGAIAGLEHDVAIVIAGADGAALVTRPEWEVSWQAWHDEGHRARGERVTEALEAAWRDCAEPIAAALARYFGPRVRLATSGGAALPLEVSEYLDAAGLTVLGAYGQTEHLCVAFNRPDRYRHGAVGLPMPGTTIRVDGDGEVLVRRNGLTFSGYHRRPEETLEAFTGDGLWLRSGDLGAVDEDGFLHITGRKKEILALSNGKKVAPLAIEARLCEARLCEARLCEARLIAHAMLYGEGRPFLTALLSLRPAMVERWREEHGIEGETADLVRHPAFVGAVREVVDRVNADVSRPERVRHFVIVPHELTLESGELTPTHKLKRSAVAARYAPLFDALYEGTQ